MSFKFFKFHSSIYDILKLQGYTTPTPIQQEAIQPILDGKDVLGLAQTGTGKTAAFSLPLLQNLSAHSGDRLSRALILSPTRELAEQTAKFIKLFTGKLKLDCAVVYGGVSRGQQIQQLRRGVDIIVACPGRLLDLTKEGVADLSKINTLILDEADQMLDKGFLPDIRKIIAKLPAHRQNLIFSATMPKEVQSLVDDLQNNPLRVSIGHEKPNQNIKHTFYQVDSRKKSGLLKTILSQETTTQSIIFTRTKYKARNLALQLSRKGFKATSLQGNLSQIKRQQALDGFKDGAYNILVATDIAARGIDVSDISHVINYDMPDTTEAYTHRTGRTGRANKSGQAVTFATDEDAKMVSSLKRILAGQLTYNALDSDKENIQRKKTASSSTRSTKQSGKPSTKNTRKKNFTRRKRAASFDFGI